MNKPEQITILEVPSELGAGTRGASLGIEAMKVAARKNGEEFFSYWEAWHMQSANHLLDQPSDTPDAKYIEAIADLYDELNKTIPSIVEDVNAFPVVLAGDHSSAGGTIAGLASAYPGKRIGVIWIDAHSDLHTPYTTPSGNVHGMPLATAIGTDNKDFALREPSPRVIKSWNRMKALGGEGKLNPEDLLFIGVRSMEEPERGFMDQRNIRNITVDEFKDKGVGGVIKETFEYLKDVDLIYISFDVDSMDPDIVSHGTGTPVAGGLDPDDVKLLLAGLVENPKVACFEMVEVNPCLDERINKMAETAFDILQNTMFIIHERISE